MHRNIEVKARVTDSRRIRDLALASGAAPVHVLHQTDTFFVVTRGRLKLRELDDGSGELIFYERLDETGPKASSYWVYPCSQPKILSTVLAQALGVRGVIEKQREVLMMDRTRVHLDDVAGLGTFLEIEVVLRDGEPAEDGGRIASELLAALNVPESSLVASAYIDLLEQTEGQRVNC